MPVPLFLLCQVIAAATADGVCTVFVHINKSGGQTVKTALYQQQHNSRSKIALCSEREYASNKCSWSSVRDHNLDGWLFLGDSTMVLSHQLSKRCTWIAMFREPASRLVSSWRYCQKSRSDHLCASSILDARDANLETWARHQRGFVFLRLAIADAFLPRAAVAPKPSATREYDDDDLRWTTNVPTWVQHQRAVLHRNVRDDKRLARTKADLAEGRLLDAVGIIERPDETAAVFDTVLPIKGGWARLFKTQKVNAASAPIAEGPLLRAARSDPNVTRHLDYDCEIFQAAEDAVNRQLDQAAALFDDTSLRLLRARRRVAPTGCV